MTEEEARQWLDEEFTVSRETWDRLEKYIALLLAENAQQNLIAASTIPDIWSRHIVDSAQLLGHADEAGGEWVDLGSGAGLPGIVLAILNPSPIQLVESRARRVAFLRHVKDELSLDHVEIAPQRLETLKRSRPAGVITARAFAPLDRLFQTASHIAGPNTLWVLPKGRNAENELETVMPTWHGVFHVERSVTDPDARIIIGRNVRKRVRL